MSTEIIEVVAGEITDIRNVWPGAEFAAGELNSDWHCFVYAIEQPRTLAVLPRLVTEKITEGGYEKFVCFLREEETKMLDPGQGEDAREYRWLIQLENTEIDPPYFGCQSITLRILPAQQQEGR